MEDEQDTTPDEGTPEDTDGSVDEESDKDVPDTDSDEEDASKGV